MKKLFNYYSSLILFYYWITNVSVQCIPRLFLLMLFLLTLNIQERIMNAKRACKSCEGDADIFDRVYINPLSIPVNHTGLISSFCLENTISIASQEISNMPKYLNAELETISETQTILNIYATPAFENFEMNQVEDRIFLQIDFSCVAGTTDWTLQQNIIIENRHSPIFSNEIYEMIVPLPLPKDFDLTYYLDIKADDNDLTQNTISFDSSSDIVNVNFKSKSGLKTSHASVTLKQQLLTINGSIEFTIIGTDMGQPSKTGMTTVKLTGNNTIQYNEGPIFAKSLYYGSIIDDVLQIEKITLETETVENVNFEIINGVGDFDMFTLEIENNILTVIAKDPIDLTDKQYLHFQIGAHLVDYRTAYTTIIINIPIIECELPQTTTTTVTTDEPCPETTTILVCPECPEVTLPPIDGTPVFEQSEYFFISYPNFIGNFGSVTANVAGQIAWIAYAIDGDVNLLAKVQINRDTGELMITEPLTQGEYVLTAIAKNPVNDEEAIATIRLTVRGINVCPNDKITVADTLLIRHLIENAPYTSIMSMVQDDCHFEIESVMPNDKEYFVIDESTNMLRTAILLDREDPQFADKPVAQIRLHLLLKCLEVTSIPTMTNFTGISTPYINDNNNRLIDFSDNIPFSIDSTYLVINIEDTNDNVPKFTHPLINNYLIGYPVPDVAEQILPLHLIQVTAIDIDEGLNAKIKYSLGDDSEFWINPETGVISPLRYSMNNEEATFLTVSATDLDGQGHQTSTTLRVVRLEAKHLTYLTIENTNNDNIDTILSYIKEETELELRLLQSAVVPFNEKTKNMDFRTMPINNKLRQTQSNDGSTIVRLVVYAFVNQQPIVTADLESALNDLDETYKIEAYPYNDSAGNNNGGGSSITEADYTVFIVVISLLSVLLLILAVVTFFGWWYWIRPYEYRKMEQTSETNLKTDFTVEGDHQTTPPTTSKYAKKDSVFVHGVPYAEEDDDVNRLSYTLNTVLENNIQVEKEQEKSNTIYNYDDTSETSTYSDGGSPSKERKKSIVTFNELVERIDIIETDDTIAQNINKTLDNRNN